MLSTILSAFRVADIRKKLAFTALMLGLYRLGSHIPVPGVDVKAVDSVQSHFGGGGVLNLLNTFSGGGLSRIALFALGIMPYITASIILQLLVVVVPSLEKLQKEGEVGQARITQYTRYLTVGLAAAQAVGYVFLFRSQASSEGTTTVSSCMMIEAVMYGMIPSANSAMRARLPPEKVLSRLRIPPLEKFSWSCWTASVLMPGAGMWAPSR